MDHYNYCLTSTSIDDIDTQNKQENRKDLIEACLNVSRGNSKIADTFNLNNIKKLHAGHIIHITENIIINVETTQRELDEPEQRLNTSKQKLDIPELKIKNYKDYVPIIDRMNWGAQSCVSEYNFLKRPAHYVIICHTTLPLEAFTQTENISSLRSIQKFHIECQEWVDIGYNFCMGSDGYAYEGRGWFAQGNHTKHYNEYSVGIAFIGCFSNHLPPASSLIKCKYLIAHGVRIGAISPDYELLGHRQCRPFLSPGDSLFEEIKTWKNFNNNIGYNTPCPLKDL